MHCTVWVIVSILPSHNYTIDNSGNDNEGWTTRYVFYTYIYYIYMDLTIFYRQTSWNDTTLAPPTSTMSECQWVWCLVNNHHAQLDNVNEGWTGDQELERWEQGLKMRLRLELPGMFFTNIFLNYSTNVFYSMLDTLTQTPPPLASLRHTQQHNIPQITSADNQHWKTGGDNNKWAVTPRTRQTTCPGV